MPLFKAASILCHSHCPVLSFKDSTSSPGLISSTGISSHSSSSSPLPLTPLRFLLILVPSATHCPTTCRLARGEVVPTPTFPLNPAIAPAESDGPVAGVPQPAIKPPFIDKAVLAEEVPIPTLPITVNFDPGTLVPIPTLPALSAKTLSFQLPGLPAPFILKDKTPPSFSAPV